MAKNKKKSAAKKKTLAKKTTNKKSAAKKKSLAKKTTTKKSAPKKKTLAKKTTSKKTSPEKKTLAKKIQKEPQSSKVFKNEALNKNESLNFFFTPLDDRILLKKEMPSNKTPGGLFIPDMVQERPNKGRVFSVGRGKFDLKGNKHPLDVKLGDHILFSSYAGDSIDIDGQEYLIIRESDVLGIVE